jgi:hypothetical protein
VAGSVEVRALAGGTLRATDRRRSTMAVEGLIFHWAGEVDGKVHNYVKP